MGRRYRSVFDHPRIAEWLAELLRRRDAGEPISGPYIARILARGAAVEGIALPFPITGPNVLRHIRERGARG